MMTIEKLEELRYPYLNDSLFKGKLTNGLTVYLQPRQDFHETYGALSVGFGAAHTTFKVDKETEQQTYPAGIAHFLEHKLFEGEDEKDLLQEFSKIGAYANAYTGLYQTNYLFSTTEKVGEALNQLIALVQTLTVSEESVAHEREIISQEIDMYHDDPDSRLYNEILASLYPGTPLQDDIAGSLSSVQEISHEDLYENFHLFYKPQNMILFLVGNFELNQIWEELQKFEVGWGEEERAIELSPLIHHPILKHRTETLEVASPKLAIGLRGNDTIPKEQLYRYRLSLSLLFSMLFGWTSKRYQELYHQGKIDSSLSFHLEVTEEAHFWILTVDTLEPIALSSLLRKAIRKFEEDSDVTVEHLELVKREVYGAFLRGLNSLEYLASNFIASLSEQENLFDVPALLDEIDLEEIIETGRRFIENCDITDFTIFPK